MKTKTKKKTAVPLTDFDPVKMMREIRDKLSREIMNMTHEEERAYLDKLLATGKKGS